MRSRSVLLIVSTLAILLIAMMPAGSMALEPTIEENLDRVANDVTRGGAVDVPGTTCDADCESAWQTERTLPELPTSDPTRPTIWQQLRNLRQRIGELPKMKLLGRLGLAAGAGIVGWEIGTGIRTKILHIGVPAKSSNPGLSNERLDWLAAGSTVPLWYDKPMPVDGFYWSFFSSFLSYQQSYEFITNGAPICPAFAPPAGMTTYTWSVPGGSCSPSVPNAGRGVAYIKDDDVASPAPPDDGAIPSPDYTTSTWPGVPAGISDVIAGLHSYLGDQPQAEAYVCSQLDEQECESPQRESSRKQCDLSTAGGVDPNPERGGRAATPEQFAARYDPAPSTALWPSEGFTPTTGPTGGRVFLRYGWTEPDGNPIIAWRGVGYRKIFAKHGWTALDVAATQQALTTDTTPTVLTKPQWVAGTRVTATSWTYQGPEYRGTSGAICRRVVVVEYEPRSNEAAAGLPSIGIVTSYGRETRLP